MLHLKADRLSASFDSDLGDAVRAAGKRSGRGPSGWLMQPPPAADLLPHIPKP